MHTISCCWIIPVYTQYILESLFFFQQYSQMRKQMHLKFIAGQYPLQPVHFILCSKACRYSFTTWETAPNDSVCEWTVQRIYSE